MGVGGLLAAPSPLPFFWRGAFFRLVVEGLCNTFVCVAVKAGSPGMPIIEGGVSHPQAIYPWIALSRRPLCAQLGWQCPKLSSVCSAPVALCFLLASISLSFSPHPRGNSGRGVATLCCFFFLGLALLLDGCNRRTVQ
eukprot:RCo018263